MYQQAIYRRAFRLTLKYLIKPVYFKIMPLMPGYLRISKKIVLGIRFAVLAVDYPKQPF